MAEVAGGTTNGRPGREPREPGLLLDVHDLEEDLGEDAVQVGAVGVDDALVGKVEDHLAALGGHVGEALEERALYWHQPHQWGARGQGIWPFSAVRRGDSKLIHDHAQGRLETYNLALDLGEANDQGQDAALAADLAQWLVEVDAQPSLHRATGDPVPPADAIQPVRIPVESRSDR